MGPTKLPIQWGFFFLPPTGIPAEACCWRLAWRLRMNASVLLLPSLFSWRRQGHVYFCSIINFTFLRLCLGHSSSSTIHSLFFFYRCVQTQCFLHKCNHNRSCFSPYSCFPRMIFKLCSPARVQKGLASPRATRSHFRFPYKNVLKIIFSRTYTKAPLFYP